MQVWIRSPIQTVSSGLKILFETLGHNVTFTYEPTAEVALWDLCSSAQYESAPVAPPTLALISNRTGDPAELLRRNYRGYLSPTDGPKRLGLALAAVRRGEIWAPRSVLSRALDNCQQDTLTPREQEVRDLLLTGLSNRDIARQLSIAEPTVKTHLSSIYAKCQVSNRAQLIARQFHPRMLGYD